MSKNYKRVRLSPQKRHEQILNVAINLALQKGYRNITRDEIADIGNVSQGLVTRYFVNIDGLKQEILQRAIDNEIIPIIAENLSIKGEQTLNLPPDLKQKVINYLTN